MLDAPLITQIGKRYQILSLLGTGGMGTVYRALDRLTGQQVALKRVTTSPQTWVSSRDDDTLHVIVSLSSHADSSTEQNMGLRLALAQEFRVLASLRHPNIISVLDYGFDDHGNPYFTMELIENARTVLDVGRDQTLEFQVSLLVQILQALAYLHRRGIIHHDLKPANLLMNGEHVKVLDFGLSVIGERDTGSHSAVGTLPYMAPEILTNTLVSEAADLYAFGVLAYELFSGRTPFKSDNISTLVQQIMSAGPDFSESNVDHRLIPILTRLLAKKPQDRFADAIQVITAIGNAIDQALLPENAATRESFLVSAHLVGRDSELAELSQALMQTMMGHGSCVLVGGESGVGKSRLLDELRIMALAQGAVVMRGQGIREGSGLYHLWRPILRWMSLLVDLTSEEASVLKPLIPDIASLLNSNVPDAPELDPEAAQTRLLTVIEAVVRRQTQTAVIILEDLQWASSENLKVLARLARIVSELPLLIIGSYRSDEAATLPSLLPEMRLFQLHRLQYKEIAALSAAMLGKAGRQEQIINLLQRETEGNVFFLVETVRALAEAAGQLDRIRETTLPITLLPGKVKDLVTNRLERVPEQARPLLQLAAVFGRQLNLTVLHELEPTVDVDGWLTTCAAIAILDVQDGIWRFAHDKLREGILSIIPETERQALHSRIASAIEVVYPNSAEYVAALAFHWRMARNLDKEQRYSILAGEQALQNGAYREAVGFLSRALKLVGTSTSQVQRANLTRQLADAHYGLGNLTQSRDYLYHVLELLDYPLPTTRLGQIVSVPREVSRHFLHQLAPRGISAAQTVDRSLSEAARACERLGQVHYLEHDKLAGLVTILRLLNLGEKLGPSAQMARSYASGTLASGILGIHSLAEIYSRRAHDTVRKYGQPLDLAYVSEVVGIYCAGTCQWTRAEEICGQAVEIYRQFGNWRWWEESLLVLAIVAYRKGAFATSEELFKEVYLSAQRRGGIESQIWGLTGYLWSLLPRGELNETVELLEALPTVKASNADRMCVCTALAEAHLLKGNPTLALEYAEQASRLALEAPPTAQFSFPGYSGLGKVFLALWEASQDEPPGKRERLQKRAHQSIQSVHAFARAFPSGRPYAFLWQGLYDWLAGKSVRAHKAWQKSAALGLQLLMPYEQGLAHYQIGRHLPLNDTAREQQLRQAADIFMRLGATADVERVQAELDKRMSNQTSSG